MEKYIIVGPARSGTTVTHLCLGGHPNVSTLTDEVKVHPFFSEGLSVFTHSNDQEAEKKAGFLAIFDTLCTLNAPNNLDAYGLKTAISNHGEAEDFVRSAQTYFPEVRIILTLRDDIVAQYGSLMRASFTGKWHSWVTQEKELGGLIKLEDDRLRAHAIDYLNTARKLQSLKETHEVFEVSFEKDILPGNQDVFYRLFDFLGLLKTEITWLKSEKVAPPPEDFIAEYERHTTDVEKLRRAFEANPVDFAVSTEAKDVKPGILQRLRCRVLPD